MYFRYCLHLCGLSVHLLSDKTLLICYMQWPWHLTAHTCQMVTYPIQMVIYPIQMVPCPILTITFPIQMSLAPYRQSLAPYSHLPHTDGHLPHIDGHLPHTECVHVEGVWLGELDGVLNSSLNFSFWDIVMHYSLICAWLNGLNDLLSSFY